MNDSAEKYRTIVLKNAHGDYKLVHRVVRLPQKFSSRCHQPGVTLCWEQMGPLPSKNDCLVFTPTLDLTADSLEVVAILDGYTHGLVLQSSIKIMVPAKPITLESTR